MDERLVALKKCFLHIGRNANYVLVINVSRSVLLKPFPPDAWENPESYDWYPAWVSNEAQIVWW